MKTSSLVRPLLCISSSAGANAITSSSPTINLTFYTNSSKGTTTLPWAIPTAAQIAELGIRSDSPYFSNIATSNCFIIRDGKNLEMGGLGTDHEAFFGFRLSPFCSGTSAFCLSSSSSLNSNFVSWINAYSARFYLPLTNYNQASKSLEPGGVYAQPIREGTSSFQTSSAIE